MIHPYLSKILTRGQLISRTTSWKLEKATVVFTNGCFDILHRGHVEYLYEASRLADYLVIGLNSQASVRRLKGPHRPIQDEQTRSAVIAALGFVDAVSVFSEDTPEELIRAISPDILVKGGDWAVSRIAGADWVIAHGGRVTTIPYLEGYSTTAIEEKIKQQP